MSTLSNIVPQLSKLKELFLPEKVAKSDPKLAAEIWEDLNYQPSPVLLRFSKNFLFAEPCSFLPDADQESDSEVESDDEESEATTETTSSEDDDDEISEDGDSYSSSNTDSS